jgi:hypothetical protein
VKKKDHVINWVFYKLTGTIEYNERKEFHFLAQFNNGMMVVDKIGMSRRENPRKNEIEIKENKNSKKINRIRRIGFFFYS